MALDNKVEPYSYIRVCISKEFLADLTVSKRPGTSFRIEIHFLVFNRFYFLFSFMKLVETLLGKEKLSLPEIWKQSKLYFVRKFGNLGRKKDF